MSFFHLHHLEPATESLLVRDAVFGFDLPMGRSHKKHNFEDEGLVFMAKHEPDNIAAADMTAEERQAAEAAGLECVSVPVGREGAKRPRATFFIHDVNKLLGNSTHETLNYRHTSKCLREDADQKYLVWQNERAARGMTAHYMNAGNAFDVCTRPTDDQGGVAFALTALAEKSKRSNFDHNRLHR
eukprot:SAG31_NODE_16019_length_727_cov_0.899682_2_plen_184_part_01